MQEITTLTWRDIYQRKMEEMTWERAYEQAVLQEEAVGVHGGDLARGAGGFPEGGWRREGGLQVLAREADEVERDARGRAGGLLLQWRLPHPIELV